MKKILVTGGLGFIGSNLVRKLSKKYFVIIVDKNNYAANINNLDGISKKRFKLYNLDIAQQKKFQSLLFKYKPVAIFNLAAETHVDRSIDNADPFIQSNILGTYSILLSLKKFYLKNKNIRLIHVSTDEVYGDIKKNKFSKETDQYLPSSPYSASKASSDHLAYAYFKTYKLPIIITNCCNNYGPRQFPEKLIPKLITNIINNKNLPIYGKGKNEREWIHVDDHNNALIKIFKKGKIGEKFNIGSGEIINNLKLSKLLLEIFKNYYKYKSKSKIIFVSDRPGHDSRYALNSKKLIKLIKFKKKFNLKKGLIDTIDWYMDNKEWINNLNKNSYLKRLGK